MFKKYFMSIIIFLLVIIFSFSVVKAEEVEAITVSDREMAIACALSYVPLTEGKTMSQNFDLGSFKLISKTVNFVNAKFNLHDYATIHELDDWTVADFHNKEISEKSMAAFVLEKDNNLIIVFRGTDTEALADVAYGINNYHNQEEYAKKYVLEILEKYSAKEGEYKIYVTGHSLGGYLAQIAGAEIARNIEQYDNLELDRIVDFNGIGINFLTYLGEEYNYGNQAETIETLKDLGKEEGKLISYYTYGDLVSALGVHYGEMRMLLPSIDSVDYHRNNYKILGNLNKRLKLSEKLDGFIEKDTFNTFNIFKTEIHAAKELYQLDDSIIAFVNLTHEADVFATIETDKAMNPVDVKLIEADTALSSHLNQEKEKIETKKSITLKAITSYASAKRYEWYESTDNQETWKLIETSTIRVDDLDYNPEEKPTNTLYVDINGFEEGQTKHYKVISYYDDYYVPGKVEKNETTKQYEWEAKGEPTGTVKYQADEIIAVTRKKESKLKFNLQKIFDIFKKWFSLRDIFNSLFKFR